MKSRRRLTDGCFATRGTILGRHLQKAVGVNFKSCDQLGLTAEHGGNAVELELTEQTVIAALCTLALIAMIEMFNARFVPSMVAKLTQGT